MAVTGSSSLIRFALNQLVPHTFSRGQRLKLQAMDPHARLAELAASLIDMRSSLVHARRQQQLARKDNSSLGCPALSDTAVRIMVMTEGRYPAAASFLRLRMPRFEARSAKVKAVLEGRYAALSVAEKAELLAPASACNRKRSVAAAKHLRECGLVDWVKHQNKTKAVCPRGQAVWRHFKRASCPEPVAGAGLGPQFQRGTGEQCVRRWARRNCVTCGKFQVGNRVPLEEARKKVPCHT